MHWVPMWGKLSKINNWHEGVETAMRTTHLRDGQWTKRNEWPDYTAQQPRRQPTS
jgi:hypothetical protein